MAEYIDKEKLIEFCKRCAEVSRDLENKCLDNIGHGDSFGGSFGAVAYFHQRAAMYEYEIPSVIDSFIASEPVKTGWWEEVQKKEKRGDTLFCWDDFVCTECEAESKWQSPYCPNCGAKMEVDNG